MRSKLYSFILSATFLILFAAHNLSAQTTLTVAPSTTFLGNNSLTAPSQVSFVLRNNNATGVLLTAIGNHCTVADNNSVWRLYYTATALTGTSTNVTIAPWTLIATSLATPVGATGITPLNFPGLSFLIPAGTQYRFALRNTGPGATRYSGTGTALSPNTFSGGGVDLLIGNAQIGGVNVGYSGSGTGITLTPRYFTGFVTFSPAVPPTCFLTCPANVTVSNDPNQCGAVVTYPAPTTAGVCGPVTASPASGSFFPVGLTTVTATASGGGMCTFTVRVNDTQPPSITCPANITTGNTTGMCGAVVTFAPSATDNCPGVVVSSVPASGSTFPIGTTTVTSTATDASGNTATCSFTVTVTDTENPSFSSPGLFPERLYYKFDGSGTSVPNLATAPPAGTATATLTGLTQGSTGKCGAALVGTGATNQSLNTNWATNMTGSWTISFWLGPNQVDNNPSYLFGDVNAASFRCFYGGAALPNNILLRGGSGDVLISGVNPAATFITIVYNGVNTVVYKNGGSPQTYAVTFTNTGAGPFRVGGYSTLASINGRLDEFGMYSRALTPAEVLSLFNTCPVNINNCPTNITVNNTPGQCGAAVTYVTPVAIDNCPGVTTTQTAGLASGATFPVGTTTNNFRATDAAGNIANCTFTVTVNDTQAPTITCPSNMTVTTPTGSCTAVVNYTVAATDNCAGVTVATVPASGSTFPLGTTTVTSTATDASGNTATCSFTVTVLDGQLPVMSSPPVNRTVCTGSNAVFSVTASNVLSYQWQQWNGSAWVNISGATSSSYTVTGVTLAMNTNTFRVILTGLCTVVTSNAVTLFVNTLPTISLTASAPPILLPAQTTTITAIVNPPGGSFVWSLNGTPITGVTGAVLGPLGVDDIGTYRAVYTDPNGCVMTSADMVVSGLASENLWVYPNPNQGQFQVRYYNQNNETLTLNIYNASGQKVYQRSFATTTAYTRMDVNLGGRYSEGVYIVEVINAAGVKVGAKRVVIRHP